MARINTLDGRVVHGTTTVSVDGVATAAPSPSGNPHWFDQVDSEVIYQNAVGTAFLQSIDLDTSALTTRSTIGANDLAAGNGVWLAFVAAGANKGERTSVGGFGPFPLAGPADVDEAGRSAFVQDYQLGRGMQAYSAAGAFVATWDVQLAPGYVIRCKSGLVAYPATGQVWALRDLTTGASVPIANRAEAINLMVPIISGGRTYLLERSERLTLRVATGSVGYVLTDDDTFNPDIAELSPGVLRIAYTTTSGEGPTTLRVIDLTLSSAATELGTTASGSLVLTPGPTLAASPVAVGPVTGGTFGAVSLTIDNHPFTDKAGVLTPRFGIPWVTAVNNALGSLSQQAGGIQSEATGGTGTTTGLTVLNGGNITPGTTPLTALADQAASTLIGRGSAAGAGPPQLITLGSGLAMTGTVLSSTATGGGAYVPITTGAEPLVFVSNGAGSALLTPYTP